MVDINNPYMEFVSTIKPVEFEEYCLKILKEYAKKENLNHFTIEHNTKIQTDDGNYQIDIYAKFIALGVEFKVLVECKRYSRAVSRETVAILESKLNSIGAHKGIIISTSGFQEGAIIYAQKHGIALIQIFDKSIMFIRNSIQLSKEERDYLSYLFIRMPKYYAREYSLNGYPTIEIYPSEEMEKEIVKEYLRKKSG